MLDLVHYNPHNQIAPSTSFRMGDFIEISDFSSTTLFCSDDTGESKVILIPAEYLPLVMERNARMFAQKISSLWISNLSEEILYEHLNPLTNGPVPVVVFIDSLFSGRYKDINFDLPKLMGGWGRQFQDEGYQALEMLVEQQLKECQNDTHDKEFLPESFLFDLHHGLLVQRFLEWDEERYLSIILELEDTDKQDMQKIHSRLREYVKTIKNSNERELFWCSLRSMQQSSFFPVVGDGIRFDFLDGVKKLGEERVFDAIVNYSFEELCLLKEEDYIDRWVRENLSEKTLQKLKEIIFFANQDSPEVIRIAWLNVSEFEELCLTLSGMWKGKEWQKNKVLKEIFTQFIDTVPVKEYTLTIETLEYALNNLPKGKRLESILWAISIEYFVVIFDKAKREEEKKYLLGLCKAQLKEIYTRVTLGDTIPYARIVHFIASGKSADAMDIFFGISGLLMGTNKEIAHKKNPLLPHKKPQSVTSRVRWVVTDLVHAKTAGGVVQSKIVWAVTSGKEYKESLLYDFHRDFYPIGAKIHFLSSITPEQVALLHQIVGFWSTPFKLLHADTSLCLPACQSPIQLIAILHRLAELGIISDDTLELQLTMAGRVPNEMAGIIGSVCLFSKIQPISYPRNTFVTSHNGETGTCIMCYDAGVLDTQNFPNLPTHISGRTDMLGFKNPMEIITYFLVSNLISQHVYGSPLLSIGEQFIHEYEWLLRLHGMESILQAKWVHNPDKENTPIEEEEHFMVVKACTDILWKNIGDYNLHGDASGLSFATKSLLYKYIIKNNLLPLDQEWTKKYLSYLKYEQRSIASKEILTVTN